MLSERESNARGQSVSKAYPLPLSCCCVVLAPGLSMQWTGTTCHLPATSPATRPDASRSLDRPRRSSSCGTLPDPRVWSSEWDDLLRQEDCINMETGKLSQGRLLNFCRLVASYTFSCRGSLSTRRRKLVRDVLGEGCSCVDVSGSVDCNHSADMRVDE